MAESPDIERMADDRERDAAAESLRYQAMQAQVEQISLTGTMAGRVSLMTTERADGVSSTSRLIRRPGFLSLVRAGGAGAAVRHAAPNIWAVPSRLS